MDKFIVIGIDQDSGEHLTEAEHPSIGSAINFAARANQLLRNVGYPETYSVWIREAAGRFEYRVDVESERFVE